MPYHLRLSLNIFFFLLISSTSPVSSYRLFHKFQSLPFSPTALTILIFPLFFLRPSHLPPFYLPHQPLPPPSFRPSPYSTPFPFLPSHSSSFSSSSSLPAFPLLSPPLFFLTLIHHPSSLSPQLTSPASPPLSPSFLPLPFLPVPHTPFTPF